MPRGSLHDDSQSCVRCRTGVNRHSLRPEQTVQTARRIAPPACRPRRHAEHPSRKHRAAGPLPLPRSSRRPRHRPARRRHRGRIHRHAVRALRPEARRRERHLHAKSPAGRHYARRRHTLHACSRQRQAHRPQAPRRIRSLRPDPAARIGHRRRYRLRRLWHRSARIQLGRLQRRRRQRQGSANAGQRAALRRSQILRRAKPSPTTAAGSTSTRKPPAKAPSAQS